MPDPDRTRTQRSTVGVGGARRPRVLQPLAAGALGLWLGLLPQACAKHDAPARPKPGPGFRPIPTAQAPSGTQANQAPSGAQANTAEPAPEPSSHAMAIPTEDERDPPQTEDAPPPDEPKRDLSAELAQAMGDATQCLQPRAAADAPTQIAIALSASVMPSGAVGRSDVQAPGLGTGEIDCLRQRLSGVHLATPIDNAPLRVRSEIHLQLVATDGDNPAQPAGAAMAGAQTGRPSSDDGTQPGAPEPSPVAAQDPTGEAP